MVPSPDPSAHLQRVQHLDCSGRVAYTLTLEVDGIVTIAFRDGRRAQLDPATGENLTPEVHLPPALVRHAAQLRPW